MRIEFKMDSTGLAFFPKQAEPTVIDTAQLPSAEAARLEQLVTDARFFDLPATPQAAPRGAADYRQYTVTVDDGTQSHTVRLNDATADPSVRALLDQLRTAAKK